MSLPSSAVAAISFAQAADRHDGELARWRGNASGALPRGVAEVLDERGEGLEPLALQVAGVGAERGEIADPAQRESQIGLATAIQAWIACPTWASHGARGSTAAAIWRTMAVLAA